MNDWGMNGYDVCSDDVKEVRLKIELRQSHLWGPDEYDGDGI